MLRFKELGGTVEWEEFINYELEKTCSLLLNLSASSQHA
jgi:hypothetical protein